MYFVLDREVVAKKKGFDVLRANGQILVPPPPTPFCEQIDIAHVLLSYFPKRFIY